MVAIQFWEICATLLYCIITHSQYSFHSVCLERFAFFLSNRRRQNQHDLLRSISKTNKLTIDLSSKSKKEKIEDILAFNVKSPRKWCSMKTRTFFDGKISFDLGSYALNKKWQYSQSELDMVSKLVRVIPNLFQISLFLRRTMECAQTHQKICINFHICWF